MSAGDAPAEEWPAKLRRLLSEDTFPRPARLGACSLDPRACTAAALCGHAVGARIDGDALFNYDAIRRRQRAAANAVWADQRSARGAHNAGRRKWHDAVRCYDDALSLVSRLELAAAKAPDDALKAVELAVQDLVKAVSFDEAEATRARLVSAVARRDALRRLCGNPAESVMSSSSDGQRNAQPAAAPRSGGAERGAPRPAVAGIRPPPEDVTVVADAPSQEGESPCPLVAAPRPRGPTLMTAQADSAKKAADKAADSASKKLKKAAKKDRKKGRKKEKKSKKSKKASSTANASSSDEEGRRRSDDEKPHPILTRPKQMWQ
ncbi:hypothetical protein M885DRAFT_557389 [Pelagophyceae sp. CCMP2097]|nr:hypothetical protein M885DRAFT_557389 [Pelagophyceae sp. CCMP2097]